MMAVIQFSCNFDAVMGGDEHSVTYSAILSRRSILFSLTDLKMDSSQIIVPFPILPTILTLHFTQVPFGITYPMLIIA